MVDVVLVRDAVLIYVDVKVVRVVEVSVCVVPTLETVMVVFMVEVTIVAVCVGTTLVDVEAFCVAVTVEVDVR